MIGFNNIFKAELYKIAKGKSLLKIFIAVAVIFIVSSLIFYFLYNLIGTASFLPQDEVTEETVEAARVEVENATQYEETLNAPQKMADTTLYSAKATYTLYKYMSDNNLSFASARMFGSTTSLTANAYILFMIQVMSIAVVVFATVSIVRSFAGERSNGTLKMQLLKPISKEAIVVGKMLAVWVVSISIFIFTLLLSAIVGICAFKVDAKTVLIVLNASSVIETSAANEIFLYFLYYVTHISQFIVFGMFMSNLIKKNEGAAIALTMVILFIGTTIERVLGYIFIGYIGLNLNIDWINSLTLSGPTLNYMNLYSQLGISIAWFVGMVAYSIFAFKKADIHT